MPGSPLPKHRNRLAVARKIPGDCSRQVPPIPLNNGRMAMLACRLLSSTSSQLTTIGKLMNWLDNALNTHTTAVLLRAKRAEILAANLANTDTPGYKARDMDFKSVFNQMKTGVLAAPVSTHRRHFNISNVASLEITYRVPTREVINGNTVEKEVEQSAFTENSIRYLASLRFLSGSIKGIILALRGE